MTNLISFKTIRFVCFGALFFVILFGGGLFFIELQAVVDSMSKPIQEERPYLNRILILQKLTSELHQSLHKQLSGSIIDNSASIKLIDHILPRVELLAAEKVIHEADMQYLDNFSKELQRLKIALTYYKEDRLHDSASSSAEEFFEIIDGSIIKINHNLNSIIGLVRRQIVDSDINILIGTQSIQLGLIGFLILIIIGTFVVLYVFNLFLSANLKKLIDGTKELGQGNFDWRIENRFDDEFGKLSASFNDMAGKISFSKDEIESQTKEIEKLAYYDSLTGLPNRNTFINKLEQEVARAERNNENMGVLYIDLDDFKIVNDSYGHDLGDLLLKAVGKRLTEHIRLSDTVARLAGDEFAIILPELNTYQDSANNPRMIPGDLSCPLYVSTRLIEELSRPFEIQNNSLTVSTSIGIAVYPDNGFTANEILHSADMAMYAAKSEGKNNFKYCTEEMTLKMLELLDIEQNIRQALYNEEFLLYYQPQVDLETLDIVGLEALIRWEHPQRGFIAPGDFIPIAEDRGFIQDISKWVLRDVYKQFRLWQQAGCTLVPVMVNLSARDFFNQGIEKHIIEILKNEEEFHGLLGIEVTETGMMDDRKNALETLKNLKKLGVKIALDDFGTGYSSLNYLQFLPIDTVKIDRSFVKNITSDPKNAAITEAIISMSHSLDLKVLAEGVETQEQHEIISEMKCDQVQGYFFYKPMPADEISKLLNKSYGEDDEFVFFSED